MGKGKGELKMLFAVKLNDNETDSLVGKILEHYKSYSPPQSAVIPVLQEIQGKLGYIPRRAFEKVSTVLKVPSSHLYGVATFYHQFRLKLLGKHIITICAGTACHIGGTNTIRNVLVRYLKLKPMEDTTDDGLFTVQIVRCIGCCSLAPIIKVDEDVYGKVEPSQIMKILAKYRRAT
ncbi:NADH-quinone oxidoreductase subunit NuoE [Candidatus Bathyarchaeota archaeon]|nr:MAG: NADH-quinone oxidoreductase subunit NuoE [Candidatus Bathyarchaeota archaeon]